MGDPHKPPIFAPTLSRRKFLLAGGTAFGAGVLGDAFYREPHAFELREVLVPVSKLPAGREVRLVHLSDLHIRSFGEYEQKVAAAVNALAPDLIVLTGDYLEEGRHINSVRRFLKLLNGRQGIFAVQGNWDYSARIEGENLRRHFAGVGVKLLINERFDVQVGATAVSVLGLDYPSAGDALRQLQANSDPARLNLLLSHVPAFSHQLLDGRVDLILCGHTHGGQVRFPFVPVFYLPRFSGRFVHGLYRVGSNNTPLYVTRGIGTSVLPVRFLCPPEITCVRLVAV